MKPREVLPPFLAALALLCAHLLPVPQDGNLAGIPSICPFKNVTGIPCPGCGLTRSVVLFAHGDWSHSIAFHPLGPIIYLCFWLVLIMGVFWLRRKPPAISQRWLLIGGSTFAASLLILWIVRLSGVLPFPAHF